MKGSCVPDLGISPNLATYMRMAHDPYNIRADSFTPEMQLNLKAEYEDIKRNKTVEQFYEEIALKLAINVLERSLNLMPSIIAVS